MRLLATALLATSLCAASAVEAAIVTLGIQGQVTSVGDPGSGILVGDAISGSVTFDDAGAGCDGACPVQSLSLNLPGGISLDESDADFGVVTVDLTGAPQLDGTFNLPAGAYGVDDGLLFAGFNLGRGFEIFAGATQVAAGTLNLVPVPAALPLLASALAGLGLVGRIRGRKLRSAA